MDFELPSRYIKTMKSRGVLVHSNSNRVDGDVYLDTYEGHSHCCGSRLIKVFRKTS